MTNEFTKEQMREISLGIAAEMSEFSATHKINLADEVIPVMAVEGHNGGLILYTEEEWTADATADWEYSSEDGLTRLGQAVNNSSLFRLYTKEQMRGISLGIAAEMGDTDTAELIATNGKQGDARVLVFSLRGVRVAATNGDPAWEEADEAAFAELMESEGIDL